MYKAKKLHTESNIYGKTKMFIWAIVFVAILIIWPDPLPLLFVDVLWASMAIYFIDIFIKIHDLKNKEKYEGHKNL